jgi:(R)-2-hydroxyacyl-CoA dehydratese activating ATPase
MASHKPIYCAGIDVGSLTAESILLADERVIASARIPARSNPLDSAQEVRSLLFQDSSLSTDDLSYTISTGYGREKIEEIGLAQENISEISCHGFGAWCLSPRVRTIIDIGGQDAKAINVDETGHLTRFAMNDKCAAGTGHFLELMSRTLEVELSDLGRLALSARRPVRMSSRCTIFVETEVIHFQQRGHSRADIAAGVADAMAERVAALARRVRPTAEVTMTGGVAKNVAVRREVEKRLDLRMLDLRFDPQLVGAYGAARLAAQKVQKQ